MCTIERKRDIMCIVYLYIYIYIYSVSGGEVAVRGRRP